MAKDSEKTPAQRLNQIRKEWGIEADEPTAKAQTQALEPLRKWLLTGGKSPEVVIRAAQVLLADPEIPGVDQRLSIEEVSQQVAETWANSGQGPQGVLGLQAMILAAWPHEKHEGGFELAPMLDSAWSVVVGRDRCRSRIDNWRRTVLEPKAQEPVPASDELVIVGHPKLNVSLKTATADVQAQLDVVRQYTNVGWGHSSSQVLNVLEANKADLASLADAVKSLSEAIGTSLASLSTQLEDKISQSLYRVSDESELLWWGQARYCKQLAKPYRRIKNPDERLWWMVFESAQLATDLDVEPTASFLVETLCQVGDDITEKRPLKQWMRELALVLRDVEYRLSKGLAELASKDALGLPVTWTWLESAESEHLEANWEERARVETGLNLDVEIDRGEWAAWVFREVLLDWHLEGK